MVKLRDTARYLMGAGSAAAFVGIGIMVHGEVNFGDAVLVGGAVAFIIGTILLAQTPSPSDDPVISKDEIFHDETLGG